LANLISFFIVESPKFLYEKKHDECVKALNKIAKVNRREPITEDELE